MMNRLCVKFLISGIVILLTVSGCASSGSFGDYAHNVTSAEQMHDFNEFMQQPDAVYLTDNNDKTMLHYAAYFGTAAMVQRLIDAGADVNASGDIRVTLVANYESDRLYRPFTPLMAAIASGDEQKVWLLINAGAEVDTLTRRARFLSDHMNDALGITPLLLAARNGQAQVVEHILNEGVTVDRYYLHNFIPAPTPDRTVIGLLFNDPDHFGRIGNAIHQAAFSGDVETLRVVLEHGANANHRIRYDRAWNPDVYGYTPLHIAAAYGTPETISLLLRAGADPNVVNNLGETPLDVAMKYSGQGEMAQLIANAGGQYGPGVAERSSSGSGFMRAVSTVAGAALTGGMSLGAQGALLGMSYQDSGSETPTRANRPPPPTTNQAATQESPFFDPPSVSGTFLEMSPESWVHEYAGVYETEHNDDRFAEHQFVLRPDGTAVLCERACESCVGTEHGDDWYVFQEAVSWAPVLNDSGEVQTTQVTYAGFRFEVDLLQLQLADGEAFNLGVMNRDGRRAIHGPYRPRWLTENDPEATTPKC